MLVEKMTNRIRSWSTRHLSFARRAQLINSVLLSMQSSWDQIFIILNAVMEKINSICKHFLWNGQSVNDKAGHVRWTEVYTHKKEGV